MPTENITRLHNLCLKVVIVHDIEVRIDWAKVYIPPNLTKDFEHLTSEGTIYITALGRYSNPAPSREKNGYTIFTGL